MANTPRGRESSSASTPLYYSEFRRGSILHQSPRRIVQILYCFPNRPSYAPDTYSCGPQAPAPKLSVANLTFLHYSTSLCPGRRSFSQTLTHWAAIVVRYTRIRMCKVDSTLKPNWLLRPPDSRHTTHDGNLLRRFRRFATVSTITLRLCNTPAATVIHLRALRYRLRHIHWISACIMLQQPGADESYRISSRDTAVLARQYMAGTFSS